MCPAEIVRDVVEARAELYRTAGERDAERVEPAETTTPASLASEQEHEEERELTHLNQHIVPTHAT